MGWIGEWIRLKHVKEDVTEYGMRQNMEWVEIWVAF